jgi:hypothetical protein
MTIDEAVRIVREQTIPALRGSGGDGHAAAVEAIADALVEREERARVFYRADGTFALLSSEAEVIERRKAAAVEIAELQVKLAEMEGRVLAALGPIVGWIDVLQAQLAAERARS